jgi:alkylated DNA repair dioxygenase AlkB
VINLALLNHGSVQIARAALDIEYWADFLPEAEATVILGALLAETPWVQPELMMYGKRVNTPRLTCWYGDPDATYVYSGIKNNPLPWSSRLSDIRRKVEAVVRSQFNSVLLNLYRDGNDSMSWHRDDEPELGSKPVIASVSLGSVRNFDFRQVRPRPSETRETYSLELAHGSLLLMRGDTQAEWEHGIAKARGVTAPRINLTFRLILPKS